MNKQQATETFYCYNCNKRVKDYHRFCYHCGSTLNKTETSLYNNQNFQSAFVFFCIYLLICLVVHVTNLFSIYSRLFWIEILIAVVTLIYAYKNYNSIGPLLKFKSFNIIILTGCIAVAAVAAVIVNVVVFKFNISFFGTDSGYYNRYSIYAMPAVVMIYSIAVNPAIFEELAFRGVMYNYLKNFLDERMVIMVTAFMFAIVHLNLISLIWLIPFGIFVGILRKKFNTIWYGVIFHFVFNLITVLFDLHRNGYFK